MGYVEILAAGGGGIKKYDSAAKLPLVGNVDGDCAVTVDTNTIYVWDDTGSHWVAVATPGAAIAIDGLIGDVTATGPGVVGATVVSVGGSSAANIHSAEGLANGAVSTNTPNTIPIRDASGNFAAGTISANLIGNVTGNASGNAGTATKLAATKNIDGQAFDGSANITVVAPATHASPLKTPIVDADEIPIADSASSFTLAHLTWANFKNTILSYIASATSTFTNKRINPRVSSIVSSATPTPNADTDDMYKVTALATGATFGVPTGTPVSGQQLIMYILDNGSQQTLSFNVGAGGYRAVGVLLPSVTIPNKRLYIASIWNSDGYWDVVGINQE